MPSGKDLLPLFRCFKLPVIVLQSRNVSTLCIPVFAPFESIGLGMERDVKM